MPIKSLVVEEAFLQLTSILPDPFHCGLFTCILSAYMRVHKWTVKYYSSYSNRTSHHPVLHDNFLRFLHKWI